MKTGEGGLIHRIMPPVDWDHGPIPEDCYDKSLSFEQIRDKILAVYLQPERVQALADSDDEMELFRTRLAIETVAEIDADTIWTINQTKE